MAYAQPAQPVSWYHFSADGRECILDKAELPTPWLNRLSNDVFSTWITHNGYIESYLLDPEWNGLTNPQQTSGRFYIRDKASGRFFQVNRPGKQVGGEAAGASEAWESRIGLGYTAVSNAAYGLQAGVTYFVPRNGDDVLVMLATVSNRSTETRTVDLFGQVEWNLGDAVKSFILHGDGRGGSQFNLYKKVTMSGNILRATQATWRSTGSCTPWPYTGFFTVSRPVTSYETIREKFLGTGRDEQDPVEVEKGACSNTGFWSRADYPWGVLQNTLTLRPGASDTLVYLLGMSRSAAAPEALAAKYSRPAAADQAFAELAAFYDSLGSAVQVSTPDTANDRIINTWTPYMWRQFFKKSLNDGIRSMGLWSYGIEGETIGMNPEIALLPFDLPLIAGGVEQMLRNQPADTGQTDLYVPIHSLLYADLGLKGPDTRHHGKFSVLHHHQMLGFLGSLYYYLLETGDLSFLDQPVPYLDGEKATVWEHLRTAMTILRKSIGPRGFPLIPRGVGDWMDEFTRISSKGQAESEMMAAEECFFLKGFADIAQRYHRPEDARRWMALYDTMKHAVNTYAWDGSWYIRAFSDRGSYPLPVGSHVNAEGEIYLNAQSWPILAGIAPPERAARSLASLRQYLSSPYGPLIFYPSYTKFTDDIGTQSIYAPGFRNGCIYLRPAGWAIMAACLAGDADLANALYQSAALKTQAADIERLHSEPYAYPENYDGPDHALAGQGEFQWNLGEGAAWMWEAYVGYILGVRPTFDGLLIDPHIPSSWDGYTVKKRFRGSTYMIEVRNPKHRSGGITTLLVDGKKTGGQLLHIPGGDPRANPPGRIHQIIVIL